MRSAAEYLALSSPAIPTMLEWLASSLDWILHFDRHLNDILAAMGSSFTILLWLIIFAETGLVVAPFLPGDSLLFAVGAIAAQTDSPLRIEWLVPLLILAAIVGDAVNYAIGKWVGPKIFHRDTGWLLNKEHLLKAEAFYQKHGAKAIVLARFLPILRTFAPFVAGIGRMPYRRFWIYNVFGGVLWVTLFLVGGYLFGNVPVIKRNFHIVILAILVLSVLPLAWEWWATCRTDRQKDASGNNP
jgi:membrane-associated protein